MGKKMKRSTTEDESSPGSSAASSSEDISREEAARRKRRRSQARRNTSKKKRSYSQGKEIIKFLAEVKEEVCKQSKQVAESKEEMSKQLAKLREEMCKQSKQVTENKEEMYNQLEKLREEMCKQSNQATASREEICKQMEKVNQDNQEMRKQLTEILTDLHKHWDLHTNGSSGDDSDAPRSQSNQVQPPRYQLVFKSGAIDKIDKGQPFDISVALVDGNDQTVENGLLANATVELVVVKAEFNQHNNQYNWSREDFESNIIKKEQQGNSATVDVDQSLKSVVSDGRFNLFQGFKCHSGSKIFRNSGNKKVRLGVMIVSPAEERVLEGLSNPFFVRGHDRPARQSNLCHNRSNTQRKALVDNGYQLQNGQTPNPQNPLSPSATQNNGGISGLNTTTRPPQLPFVGNTSLLSSGLNINGEPQLPFVGNTHVSTEPSTSQQQRASIQHDLFPHIPMMAQATNSQIDELPSSALVGHLGSPNYNGNSHVPVHEFELPGRGGDTTDIELPAGFRFRPTDTELIVDYLCDRDAAKALHIIAELDIYKFDPWDLPAKAAFGEDEWYFFSPRYSIRYRHNRVAGSGYWNWKTTRAIPVSARSDKMLGFKKTLVFYTGVPPEGKETGWVMQEYHRIFAKTCGPTTSCSHTEGSSTSTSTMRLDEWVLCRIYTKTRLSVKSSYGKQLPQFLTYAELPGFRFSPTDKELILDYLLRRATGAPFMVSIISEVDIYKVEPWDLPSKANLGEFEWYFLYRREHESYATGTCTNSTTEGYWKATGIDRPITVLADDDDTKLKTVGFKKALVFYMGRPPRDHKTNWIMQEYRLHDNLLSANESASSITSTSDEWLLYKVGHMNGELNQLTTPFQDDRLLQQLRLQDDDLSNSFLTPAPSTMPSTSSSISDCITHLTPTPSTLEPPSSPWSLFWS